MKRKKGKAGFAVAQCSVCDRITVVVGGAPGIDPRSIGAVRWCRDCIQISFGWFQMNEDERSRLLGLYDGHLNDPKAKPILDAAAAVPEETRKAMAIGDSRRRLVDAMAEESR